MDLFVLETPLQLLNAIEARHHFGDRPSALVLLGWPGWTDSAFTELLEQLRWDYLIRMSMVIERPSFKVQLPMSETIAEYVWTFRQFARRRQLESILKRFSSVDRLVLGNLFTEHARHIATCVRHAELVAVDDGTDTLRAVKIRNQTFASPAEKIRKSGFGALKQRFRERYVEWDTRQPNRLTFFSAYAIDVPPQDRLITNEYRWLRSRMVSGSEQKGVYFLGQPLIEDGYVEESVYLGYLKGVLRHFEHEQVIYVPHKRESERTPRLVTERLGCRVATFTRPIEVELALTEERPKVLASFFCSALDNCATIFGNGLDVFAVYLPRSVLKCSQESVEGCYRYFQERQTKWFRVVDLECACAT